MKASHQTIVYALDVPSLAEAREQVRCLDGHVGLFKIGLELFIQEGPGIINMVRNESRAGIFLDLKLHDISETVKRAMSRIAGMGVDLVTVHCSSTSVMVEKAVEGASGKTGVLGVTLLTDNDADAIQEAGFHSRYADNPVELVLLRARMAKRAGCRGVVCSGREVETVKMHLGTEFLAVTPGIRPSWSLVKQDDQARITTPAMAVAAGADLIVVGRPIRNAPDPAEAARKIAAEIREACQCGDASSRPKAE